MNLFDQAQRDLLTVRDLLRFAVSRFGEADVFFGHGSDNAWDEAAYLILHTLHLPPDRLDPYIDARLTHDERAAVLKIIARRIDERLPAAYLTHEAWLGEYRFYVDERVIVPRSHIAELLREQLTPWVDDPWAVGRVLDLESELDFTFKNMSLPKDPTVEQIVALIQDSMGRGQQT